MNRKPITILLVEDNPGDVRLAREALQEVNLRQHLHVAEDGAKALSFLRGREPYLRAPRPDLILLDLNLPKLNGLEVLAEIKRDEALRRIPVVVLTSSQAEQDILRSYELQANAYVTKPPRLDQFLTVLASIRGFWLETVKLPQE